ncbi:MAG: type VI secretion system-associated FHA domain protein TagH [Pseudomonadota bacterium]
MAVKLIITAGDIDPAQASRELPKGSAVVIGRGAGCDWKLPDPGRHLSKQHCRIEVDDQGVRLTDTSTNGVFLNGQRARLPKGQAVTLINGQTIRLGSYEMRIETAVAATMDGSAQAALDPFAAPVSPVAPTSSRLPGMASGSGDAPDPFADPLAPQEGDWSDPFAQESLKGGVSPLDDPLPSSTPAPQPDHGALADQYFEPPKPVIPDDWGTGVGGSAGAGAAQIPEDWGTPPPAPPIPPPSSSPSSSPVDATPQPPAVTPAQAPPVIPEQTPTTAASPTPEGDTASQDLLVSFLGGIGVPEKFANIVTKQPDHGVAFMTRAGQMFSQLVGGLHRILMSRVTVKEQFGVEQTLIRAADNNPLKFAPTEEEAVMALLADVRKGFLSGEQAINEGFEDITRHQMATIAAIQIALNQVLARLSPTQISKRVDKGARGLSGRDARCWREYQQVYEEIQRVVSGDHHRVFAAAFAKAYKQQESQVPTHTETQVAAPAASPGASSAAAPNSGLARHKNARNR